TIRYSLPKASNVTLKVYDIIGNEVSTLVNEFKVPGNYQIKFDASRLSSGVYFYRIKTEYFTSSKKLILLK
ncbi:MAG TPA: T9SS type A sorting domain-containing protein, partial [Ignavibacteriaceae bacterium]